jgi:hypothetical protein
MANPFFLVIMGTFVWRQDWPTSTGHARMKHWHKHNRLHPLQPGTLQKVQGRNVWPNHMLGPTRKNDKPNRTRLVAGGNRVHYPGNAGTPTANLLTIKLLINSTISTTGAKFMTMDTKDFYLNTPMAQYEYMQLKLSGMVRA